MKSEDDPEARIRALEQPLAETARASEAGESQAPSKWTAPSGPPYQPPPSQPPTYQPPPLPYSGSLSGPSLQTSYRGRIWWIVAGVFVVGMIALPAAILFFTAHQVSHSGLATLLPIPSVSPELPAPPSGVSHAPAAGPSTTIAVTPTAPVTENLIVSGINENRTVVCNQNTVSVSGVSNTVVITGHCTRLSVSGVQNKVTVEGADSIEASGFSNQITYRKGSPQVEQSGQGNVVHQG